MSAAAELRPAITSAQVLPYRRHHAKPWVFAALVTVGMLSAAAYQFVGERPRGNTRPVAAAMTDMAAGEIRLTTPRCTRSASSQFWSMSSGPSA